MVRPKTENLNRLGKRKLALLRTETPADGLPRLPATRGECRDVPRPCPFVSCRHHMFLEISRTGNVTYRFPDLEPDQLPPGRSCALDIADEGPATLEDAGQVFNVTRERFRQMEALALAAFTERLSPSLREEFREAVAEALNRPGSGTPLGEVEEESGEGNGYRSVERRRADYIGLTRADEWEVERWTNEVIVLLREGRSLEEAQALANGHPVGETTLPEVVGPEQRPRSLLGAAVVREEATQMACVGIQETTRLRREQVLHMMEVRGPQTTRAVAEETGMDLGNGTATIFMQNMERDGLVRSYREGRGAITWALPGQEVPRAEARPAPPPVVTESPRESPSLAKMGRGKDQDPVALIRARRDALAAERAEFLAEIDAKIQKLDVALAALE